MSNMLKVCLVVVLVFIAESRSSKPAKCDEAIGLFAKQAPNYYLQTYSDLNSSYYARICTKSQQAELQNCVEGIDVNCVNKDKQRKASQTLISLSDDICSNDGKSAIDQLEASKCLDNEIKKQKVKDAVKTCVPSYTEESQLARLLDENATTCWTKGLENDCTDWGADIFTHVYSLLLKVAYGE
ncbi:uncharacterized protein LOC131941900 [Physella acuta]|uniref:uncharacterized protein LOC131941900 n=1 Tax=Physella acuta TaxID=109671 RepID=UPI0027DE8ED1|nr:uncharacterized protein LOC131941900 [Physella acuta]